MKEDDRASFVGSRIACWEQLKIFLKIVFFPKAFVYLSSCLALMFGVFGGVWDSQSLDTVMP